MARHRRQLLTNVVLVLGLAACALLFYAVAWGLTGVGYRHGLIPDWSISRLDRTIFLPVTAYKNGDLPGADVFNEVSDRMGWQERPATRSVILQ